jgi:flagellin-specific chaperone FliS
LESPSFIILPEIFVFFELMSHTLAHQQEMEKKLGELAKAIEIIERNRQEDKTEGAKSLCEFKERYDFSLATLEQSMHMSNAETLLKVSTMMGKVEALETERIHISNALASAQTNSSPLPIVENNNNLARAESLGGAAQMLSEDWKVQWEGLKSAVTNATSCCEKVKLDLGMLFAGFLSFFVRMFRIV